MVAIPLALLLIQAQPSPLLRHALAEWKKYPEMRAEDAYKWLYHATLGGEHAVTSKLAALQWLDREWKTLGPPLSNEPQVVKLTPDGTMLRVNLRPYRAKGGKRERILSAFLVSAKAFKTDKARFRAEWLGLRRVLPIGKVSVEEWKKVDGLTRGAGYPAIEHSNEYLRAYRPAYRVVSSRYWTKP